MGFWPLRQSFLGPGMETLLDVNAKTVSMLWCFMDWLDICTPFAVYRHTFLHNLRASAGEIAKVEDELHDRVSIVDGMPMWEWHGKHYIGAGHGSLGIAYMLRSAKYTTCWGSASEPREHLCLIGGQEHVTCSMVSWSTSRLAFKPQNGRLY